MGLPIHPPTGSPWLHRPKAIRSLFLGAGKVRPPGVRQGTTTRRVFDGHETRKVPMRDKPRRKSEARFRTLVGRPWQLWSDPRRPPCGDRKIGAHATAVCCSAAGLGWAEEDQ